MMRHSPTILDGSPASEGIASGKIFKLEWGVPVVPHKSIADDDVDAEIERFHEARAWTRDRLEETKALTEERLGSVEGRMS